MRAITYATRKLCFFECFASIVQSGNLVSCSEDKTIKVLGVERRAGTKICIGHTDAVFHTILLNNGNIASASADKFIKLWNFEASMCILTLTGHANMIRSLCQKETGELISSSDNKSIKI